MITLTNNDDTIDQSAILELGDVIENFFNVYDSLDNGGGIDGLSAYILSHGYQKI